MTPALEEIKRQFHESETGKLLIIGSKTTNFTQEDRDNERIIFWESTHMEPSRLHYIPSEVKWIVITRFLGHNVVERIKKIKRDDQVFLNLAQGTGTLRKLIRGDKPMAATKDQTAQNGEEQVTKIGWLREHIDVYGPKVAEQITAVLPQAQAIWPGIGVRALVANVTAMRSRERMQGKLSRERIEKPKKKKAAVSPPTPVAAPRVAAEVPGTLGELKKHLLDMRDTLELAVLQLDELNAEYAALQARVARAEHVAKHAKA